MNGRGYYQQQKQQGAGSYNRYDDKHSFEGLLERQIYAMNTPPTPPR